VIRVWEVRRPPTAKICTTKGVVDGKESYWIP